MRISLLLFIATSLLTGCASRGRIPVILDTDIGDDIDDTWALVMLLKSPRLDVKLITTTNGQQDYRARLVAKILTVAGRTDIPIGLGAGKQTGSGKQEPWIHDFPLSVYRGKIYSDGVQAMVDAPARTRGRLTLIAIGPLQTVAMALERDHSLASKMNFVGMHGSVFRGYGGAPVPQAEFNVKTDVAAAQKVLAAPWKSVAITPLDTCGLKQISISGERYKKLKASNDPLVQLILENYRIWNRAPKADSLSASSTLYDTVAIYLAEPPHPLLNTEQLDIRVSDDGHTALAADGKPMSVATSWKNVEAYRDLLVGRLLRPH